MNESPDLSRRNQISKSVIINVDYGDDYEVRMTSCCAICEAAEPVLTIGNNAGVCFECIEFAFRLYKEGNVLICEKYFNDHLLKKDYCSSISKIKHCE